MRETAVVVEADDFEWIEPANHTGSWSKLLLRADDDNASIELRLSLTPPGGRIDAHRHEEARHLYFVVSGTGILELDGAETSFGPSMAVMIPAGVPHALYNKGSEDLYTVFVSSPALTE